MWWVAGCGRIVGWLESVNGWVGGWIGWIDGWTGGRMDGWWVGWWIWIWLKGRWTQKQKRLPEYDDFMNDKLYNVNMMDGYRMIELGQELGYVKEMGQTCDASNGTSLVTPHRLGSWHACSGRWQRWCVRFSWLLTSRRVRPLWPQGTGRVWRSSIRWNRWGDPLSNSVQPAHPCILHTQICVFGVVQHFYTKRIQKE